VGADGGPEARPRGGGGAGGGAAGAGGASDPEPEVPEAGGCQCSPMHRPDGGAWAPFALLAAFWFARRRRA
jgi:uncharacterized protein (TIGR03382 family)